MKKKKVKTRNPIARVVKSIRPKVVPDKKQKIKRTRTKKVF